MKFKHNHKQFFQKLTKEKNVCFLHSENKKIIAFNPASKFSYKNNKEKIKLEEFVNKERKKGRKIIGFFSYDIAYKLHNVKQTAKDDLNLPDIHFYSFKNWIENSKIHSKDKSYLKKIEEIANREIEKPQKHRSKNFKTTTKKSDYKKAYKKIKNYIKEGDIYQINLTHRLEAETDMPAKELFIKTLKHNKVEYAAYIEGEGFEILSASPERFVKIENRKIQTCPIKGTIKKGKNAKKNLLESEKEAAELNMITDLMRNDMGKIAKIGSVKVEGHRLFKECPTIWHTYSKITAEVSPKFSNIEALISMQPGGSITGCPKKRAIEIIDELEPTTRSIYTGKIGHISPNGDLDFNIAIRTIIKIGNKLYLQVGGGIVLDSTDKAEFQETLDKASSFLKILC